MGYSDAENSVRVDFFKESGKWYTTEAVKWLTWKGWTPEGEGKHIHAAFAEALNAAGIGLGGRLTGMTAVCLEPYHENAHPLMVKI